MVPTRGGSHGPGHVRRWLDGITLEPGPIVQSWMNLAFCFSWLQTPQAMVLFWLRNTFVHDILLTGLEEGLPSRSRELQRARRNGRGNERRGGAFGNRNRMSFIASYPAIIAAQKGRLGNASAQNRAQVKQYRYVICCLGCVFPAGAVLQISSLFTSSLGHRKTVNILPIFSYL